MAQDPRALLQKVRFIDYLSALGVYLTAIPGG